MNKEDIKQVRRNVQRLERLSEQLEDKAELLQDNNVDTTTSLSLEETQTEVQDEMEQLVADILQLLAETDVIGESSVELPQNRRGPVTNSNLPNPRVGRREGPPPWANGNNGNGNNGNGNN